MGFTVERVRLRNFRSYIDQEVYLDPSLTIIYGPNAAGKTNIVEAIQLVTEGSSFRAPSWGDVVRWGGEVARVDLVASGEGRERQVHLEVAGNSRVYTVNSKRIRSASDVAGPIPCVIFTPNDMRLVKETADRRRDEIDSLGAQLSKSYGKLRAEYGKVVSQRNKLLKDEYPDHLTLAAWTDRLVAVGAALTEHRVKLVERLTPHLTEAFRAIDPNQQLGVAYQHSSYSGLADGYLTSTRAEREEHYRDELAAREADELSRRVTLVGPHRDDIVFTIDGRDARTFGSQGQQRTIALAWKLAEVQTVRDISGTSPILLLDDVMSELDESRRKALTTVVGSIAQTVVTTAHIEYFDSVLRGRAKVISIDRLGILTEERSEDPDLRSAEQVTIHEGDFSGDSGVVD